MQINKREAQRNAAKSGSRIGGERLKVNAIKISRMDSVFDVEINGILLENV